MHLDSPTGKLLQGMVHLVKLPVKESRAEGSLSTWDVKKLFPCNTVYVRHPTTARAEAGFRVMYPLLSDLVGEPGLHGADIPASE